MPKFTPGQRLTLRGHLGYTPELRHTPDEGKPVTDFSLAVDQGHKEGDEWVQDEPIWFKVIAWEHDAKHVAKSLKTGNRVVVTGRFKREHNWTTRDGEDRTDLEVTADEIAASIKFNDVTIHPTSRNTSIDVATAGVDAGSSVSTSI